MKIIETIEKILVSFLTFIQRGDYISNIKNNILYLLDTFINTKEYYIPTIIISIFIIIYLFSYLYSPSGLKWKNMGIYDPDDISIKTKKEIFNSNLSNYLTDSNLEISTIPDDQFYYFNLDKKSLVNVYIKSNDETPEYFIPITIPNNIILSIGSILVFLVIFFIYFLVYRTKYYYIVESKDSHTKRTKKIFYDKQEKSDDKKDKSNSDSVQTEYEKADAREDFLNPLLEVYKRLAQISVAIMLPFLLVYFILFMYKNFIETHTIIVLALVILFIIISLAIVANVFKPLVDSSCDLDDFYPNPKNDSDNLETEASKPIETKDFNLLQKIIKFFKLVVCIVLNLVFAIPCILLIFVEKIKDEIQITTPTTFILLLIQIVIIFLIIIIPKLYNSAYNSLSNNILKDYNEKVKLNRSTQLSYQDIIGATINKPKTITIADYSISLDFFGLGKSNPVKNPHNYSITFSLYIKPDNKNLFFEDKNIIDFCKQPQILFDPKKFELIVKSNDNEIYRTDYFKLQYFNKIKIEYNSNNIDIYINDYLRYSNNHSYSNLGKNSNNDIIMIGDENGIYGTIKDLYYENM